MLEQPKFSISATTILFVEGPDVSTAKNLRAYVDNQLKLNYGVDFHSMQQTFTVVTVLGKPCGSSVELLCTKPENGFPQDNLIVVSNRQGDH